MERVNLYVLPTGRRLFCCRQVHRESLEVDAPAVAAMAQTAITHDEETLQLEIRRRSESRTNRFSPQMTRLDGRLDRAVTGVDVFLDSQMRLHDGTARAEAAGKLRTVFFPEGVGVITRAPYVQESEQVAALLARAQEPELANTLAEVPGIDDCLQQLTLHYQAYYQALSRDLQEIPTNEKVREMQATGQEYLARIVILVLADCIRTGNEDSSRRLLDPIDRQQQAVAERRRRRRQPTDIDPDTGEELGDADLQLAETASS